MSQNEKSKILITGANGFVGSHICRRLVEDKYEITAGVREGCDISPIQDLDIEIRFGDIVYPEQMPEFVAGFDCIIHNAGLVKATSSDIFYKVNEEGTRNIIKAAVENKVKKFILISSLAAAGSSVSDNPRTEEMPPQPLTEYGRSKLAGEKAALEYADQIEIIILRPSGVYGPGDKEMLTFFATLNNRIRPYLGSLSRRLQLVHVDDLAHAVSLAITARVESGSTYFIAENRSYSYYRLVNLLRRAVGRSAFPIYLPGWLLKIIAKISASWCRKIGKTPMFTPEKASELLASWEVSIAKAKEEIMFESEIDFEKGALETIRWYRLEDWL